MQIQFPRRIQMGLRPWYGLTLRQLAYLVVAGITAGAVVLFGPVEGNGLLVRVLIGLGIISIGVALAFFRKDGLTAEQWIATHQILVASAETCLDTWRLAIRVSARSSRRNCD